ncbi:MAG: Gfo/Idh/MocA family protein [Limisphaerales bacterium]
MSTSNEQSALSRRSFIKNTTTTAAGLSLLGGLSIERSAYAAGSDTIKLALVGCGNRGSGAVDNALKTPGTKLVAMADVFQKRIDESLAVLTGQEAAEDPTAAKPIKMKVDKDQAKQIDVPPARQFVGFDAYKKAIAEADIVIIAGPPGFRPVHFEEAVRQGKHVFMEKPMGTDAPGIRRILAANQIAKEKNLKCGVGFQRHHENSYLEMMKRVHGGDIGDVLAIRVYWRGGSRGGIPKLPGESELAYQIRNWYFFTYLSGDHIVEQHCHNIDVGNWIKTLDPTKPAHPIRAHGLGGRQVRNDPKLNGQIFDHHFVEFEYEDGTRMTSECSQIPKLWGNTSEHAIGTKGSVDFGGSNRSQIKGAKPFRFKGGNEPYVQEHRDLIAAVRNNQKYNEVDASAYSTMTAIMGRMATYSGEQIEWDDAFNSKLVLMPEITGWNDPAPVQPDANGVYPVAVPGVTRAL